MKAKVKSTGEIVEVLMNIYGKYDRVENDLFTWSYEQDELDFDIDTHKKQSVTIEGYVARDKLYNRLQLFENRADRGYKLYRSRSAPDIIEEDIWDSEMSIPFDLPKSEFLDLKWEDEPRKVRIKIEEI